MWPNAANTTFRYTHGLIENSLWNVCNFFLHNSHMCKNWQLIISKAETISNQNCYIMLYMKPVGIEYKWFIVKVRWKTEQLSNPRTFAGGFANCTYPFVYHFRIKCFKICYKHQSPRILCNIFGSYVVEGTYREFIWFLPNKVCPLKRICYGRPNDTICNEYELWYTVSNFKTEWYCLRAYATVARSLSLTMIWISSRCLI